MAYTDKWLVTVELPSSTEDEKYWAKVNVKLTTSEIKRLRKAEQGAPDTDGVNRVADFLIGLVDSWNLDEPAPERDGFGPDTEGQAAYEAAQAGWEDRKGIMPINARTLDLLDHGDTKALLERITAGRKGRDPKEQTDF